MSSGPLGLLQPVADGIKLLGKETIIPSGANAVLFLMAPMLTFFLALSAWAVIPFGVGVVLADINGLHILYLFAISSLSVYGIIIAGWASNSKSPFLGGLRSAAQMVSYEVSIGLVDHHGSAVHRLVEPFSRLSEAQSGGFWHWYIFKNYLLLFPMFIVFFISALAKLTAIRSICRKGNPNSSAGSILSVVDELRSVLPR